MRSQSIHSFLIATAFIASVTVSSASGQSLLKNSKYIPGPFEISIGISQLPIYPANASFIKRQPTGLKVQAGFRPKFSNRHLLLEAFFQHIPKKNNTAYYNRNQINLFGLDANYLILNPEMRINPFVGVGYGLYTFQTYIYFYPDYACSVINGCPAFSNPQKTYQTLVLRSGLYVTVIPEIAVRGGITMFRHLGSYDNETGIDKSKLAPSFEVSVRF